MKRRWWSSEWFAGVTIVTLFALTLRPEPLAGVEGWSYDLVTTLTMPLHADDGVVVIASDDAVSASSGAAWPRDPARRLLELLARAEARAVTLVWPLDRPYYPAELSALGQEAERLLLQQPVEQESPFLQRVAELATGEQRLANAMRKVDHLTLATTPAVPWSAQWHWTPHEIVAAAAPQATASMQAAPIFTTAAGTLAHDTLMYDPAGVVRRVPLLYYRHDRSYVPTLPLQLLAQRLHIAPVEVRHAEPRGLSLGDVTIASDGAGYFYPRWGRGGVRTIALAALLNGSPELLASLRDRVVLVGPTTPSLTAMATLPDGRQVAPVELAAMTVSALLANEAITLPPYARWAQLGGLLLVALLLTQLLPRLGSGMVLAIGVVLLLVLLNTQLLLFFLHREWLPLTVPLLALAGGMLVLLTRRRLRHSFERLRQQLGRTTVALAAQLRQQGKLDDALFHLQQSPVGLASEELYQLGLDYERKRQFNRAEQVFAHITQEQPRFRDAAERVRINREAGERLVIAGHPSAQMATTLVMDQAALQKPVVGRYQVERELGRGAMGMVYLGHDPKISRTVAIKTVNLANDADGQQLQVVRERFFREAESAGRLSHPHIVTIYDVGEEGDLAYIAMDYLPGVSLDHHTSQEQLLPVKEVLALIAQVADALDYAHGKGVIHRDIKPANIIYERERHQATVTDFGVAHLADASKTRTGTILGSPYYMAPEALAGARVDGRADLFSLGVTFYQLLTGCLPFEADSIATLMYKITHSRHASVGKLRSGVPSCVSRIVNQLLQKDVEKRYQSGADLYKALQRCMK
ncbi:MAG TPA: serine/threonine-protein kinase [Gammaproteobacteria bacterium]